MKSEYGNENEAGREIYLLFLIFFVLFFVSEQLYIYKGF